MDKETLKMINELEEKGYSDRVGKIRKCRVCGCTDFNACEGGCYWVEEDLCNKCVEKVKERKGEHELYKD